MMIQTKMKMTKAARRAMEITHQLLLAHKALATTNLHLLKKRTHLMNNKQQSKVKTKQRKKLLIPNHNSNPHNLQIKRVLV